MPKINIKVLWLLRVGLAAVFLTNSITAAMSSPEFSDLISGSFVGKIIPAAIMLKVIMINDGLVALLLLFCTKWLRVVSIWAALWVLGVLIVIAEPLAILEESSYIFMALAIFFSTKIWTNKKFWKDWRQTRWNWIRYLCPQKRPVSISCGFSS